MVIHVNLKKVFDIALHPILPKPQHQHEIRTGGITILAPPLYAQSLPSPLYAQFFIIISLSIFTSSLSPHLLSPPLCISSFILLLLFLVLSSPTLISSPPIPLPESQKAFQRLSCTPTSLYPLLRRQVVAIRAMLPLARKRILQRNAKDYERECEDVDQCV